MKVTCSACGGGGDECKACNGTGMVEAVGIISSIDREAKTATILPIDIQPEQGKPAPGLTTRRKK